MLESAVLIVVLVELVVLIPLSKHASCRDYFTLGDEEQRVHAAGLHLYWDCILVSKYITKYINTCFGDKRLGDTRYFIILLKKKAVIPARCRARSPGVA